MISTRHGFIFLHVPKTGGNAVQTLLLPLSDDRMMATGAQDGVNRFAIRGPVTPHKHATLQEYADRLGTALRSYRTIITLRPPFERMVSLYFSPHRWPSGAPVWDRSAFLAMARNAPSTAHFLTVAGTMQRPDFILRFESLAHDLARVAAALGLPLSEADLPFRNASAGTAGAMRHILADHALRSTVEEIFRDDIMLTSVAQRQQVPHG